MTPSEKKKIRLDFVEKIKGLEDIPTQLAVSSDEHSHTYSDGKSVWDVKDLWKAVEDIEPETILISDIIEFDQFLDSYSWSAGPMSNRDILDHVKRIEFADDKYPIIVTPTGAIADGCHRIMKNINEGKIYISVKKLKTMPEPIPISELNSTDITPELEPEYSAPKEPTTLPRKKNKPMLVTDRLDLKLNEDLFNLNKSVRIEYGYRDYIMISFWVKRKGPIFEDYMVKENIFARKSNFKKRRIGCYFKGVNPAHVIDLLSQAYPDAEFLIKKVK